MAVDETAVDEATAVGAVAGIVSERYAVLLVVLENMFMYPSSFSEGK